MKKFGKWVAYIVITVILLVIIVISYVVYALPDVGKPEDIKIALTPQRIARGAYLANNQVACMTCHSGHDETIFARPVIPPLLGAGGEKFDKSTGFPGTLYAVNITPFNLKNWTDGEILRAITCGVKKDGSPIFPLMPWQYYSKMSREDVYSIIAYLRTISPVTTTYPKHQLDFPLNILMHTFPKKESLIAVAPDPRDTLKYGAYVVQISACMECHTQEIQGKLVAGMEYAGGRGFPIPPYAVVKSANITPDKNTGIGSWSKETFVHMFSRFANDTAPQKVKPGDFQTVMPWRCYSKMTKADIEAIYAYLKTLKPVNNKVVKFVVNSAPSSPSVN